MIAADLAVALDPVRLAVGAGITPDPWQVEVLRSDSSRILLNCCRQAGKSTVTAVLATHTALYQPRSLTLLLSPSLRQSQELFRKVLAVYRARDRPVSARTENALSLELATGSRIHCLPGTEATVRGFSAVDLLVVDEAARVANALYAAVRPMLAVSGGRLVALSTPFGARGWWYEAWAQGGADWERWEVPASVCPRISSAFLEEERRTVGEWWFRQEYGCEFLDAQSRAFRREDIEQAVAEEVESWHL